MKSRFIIDRLISSIENSDINQIDKLKIIKVLLAIKIKLIEFSDKDMVRQAHHNIKAVNKVPIKRGNGRPVERDDSSFERGRDHTRPSEKHNLIIQFIKNKGGRVNAAELSSLGLAGRSLRRYIKDLCQENKMKIEKSGRNYFYLVA
ncbi:MAG: hypothetical protein AAB338_02795 [Patescibacteria group bacterium]